VVAGEAGGALEDVVVECAVVDEAGGGDHDEGIELVGVGGSAYGYNAHHELSSAPLVQYLVLPLLSHREERHRVYGLGHLADEVGVLSAQHVVVADVEEGVRLGTGH